MVPGQSEPEEEIIRPLRLPAAGPVLNGSRRDAADRLRAVSRRPARNGAGCGRDFRLCKADSVLLLRLRGRNVCRRRLGRVIGLENDDDDRRDDQNQSGRGVEVEAFAEVDDADQYGRQGFEVIVEPICLIASTSVRLESTVGSRASNNRLRQMCHVWTTAMPDVERA